MHLPRNVTVRTATTVVGRLGRLTFPQHTLCLMWVNGCISYFMSMRSNSKTICSAAPTIDFGHEEQRSGI